MADKTLADLLLEGEPATPDVFNVDNQTAQTGSARPSLADYLLTDTDTQLQVGTIPEQDVTRVPFKDADTWTGNFGLTIDQAQRDSFDMIRILGKRSGFEALENLGISGMSRNAAEIAQYKPKLESASLEKNIDNIINAYGEEGFLAAIGEFGEGLTQMTSSATASMALPLTGAAAAAAAAATLPVAAVSTGVAATVGAVIASIPQAGGSVYDEARKLGASEEDAENAAMIAAPLIGAAEAFVPARLFSGAVKKMGKDAVIDATAKHVGKVAARSAVERSMDLVKAGGKAFGKAGKAGLGVGLKESATEVIQEKLQISAAGLAADKGVSPYDTKEEIWRLLDAGALGLVGGQSMGSIGSIATQYEARAARQEADLVSEADAEVAKSNDTFNQQATKYTNISDNGVLRGLRSAVSRSTSLLDRAAKKYDSVARVKNAFDSYTDYVNADFGNYATQITDVFKPLYRNVKLPYASPVAKVDEEAVFDYLAGQEGNYTATQIEVAENLKPILGTQTQKQINLKRKDIKSFLSDPESFKSLLDTEGTGMSVTDKAKYNQSLNSLVQEYNTQIEKLTGEGIKNSKAKTMAADALTGKANKKKASVHYKALTSQPIQKAAGTGLFGDLLQANQNINFVDNYIPIRLMFKSKKNREKMKHILVSEHAFTPTEADNFVGNVRKSGGFANPDINLDMPQVYKKEGKSQSENQRTLNDDIRKSFIEAGLVDKNILGILYEYALDTSRRKNLQDIKQRVDDLKTSPDKPKLEQFEADRIVDVFNAIQGNYKTMDPDVRAAFSGAQFLGYVTTMPLAALSAIAEPAILLYTYGPRHVVPATFGAIYRTGRKAVREVFPKALPINKKEQAIRNTAQGWDEAVTDRLNEIEQIGLGRKLTNVFFKLTLLTQLTQLSRDIAADAGRRALRYDLQQVYNARDKGEKTRASVDSQRRLNKVGINNIFYPENKKILEEWVAGKYDKDPQNEPQLIRLAQSKMINDAIMAPDATKKPLWMSNPALAPVAQLKSFMFVFGNTVGYKMWTDLYQPLIKQGRFPAQQAFRGALALSTIMALSAFAQMLRDEIRYGDEDSPYDDMTEDEKLTYLLNRTAIGGPFQLIWDAFHGSSKYGGTPLDSFVGPVASKATTLGKELVSAAADGNVRGLSREALSLVPFLGTLSMERDIKADAVDALEELLEDNVVNRKHGGKVVQRAEGGQVAPTNEEMLKWDQVEGTDTTTEGSGSGAYDAATEGKLASYLSGEAKDAYNFLKNYDYSDLDIMDTLQKGGTAMLTGIADSIKSGVDASTKAVAGQEYNSNKMLGLVGGVGAGSAMFSAPKGALRSLGGKGKKASDVLAALKKSKLQGDFYHGTSSLEKGKALDNLKASKEGALGEGVYLTPSGDRASFYARLRADEVGGDAAVYPVRVDMSNPLEITGTHTDPVVEALVKLGVDEDKAYAISEKASETKGYITKEISSRAKKAGYDGIIQRVPDGRIGEVVVFDKDKVFSSVKFNEKLTPKEEGFKKPKLDNPKQFYTGEDGFLKKADGEDVVVYHSTDSPEMFDEFNTGNSKENLSDAKFLSFATNPETIQSYGLQVKDFNTGEMSPGARTIMGKIKSDRIFDFNDPKEVEKLSNHIVDKKIEVIQKNIDEFKTRNLNREYWEKQYKHLEDDDLREKYIQDNIETGKMQIELFEDMLKQSKERRDYLKRQIQEGSFTTIESNLQPLKELGYEGFTTYENGKNVMLFNPEKSFIPVFDPDRSKGKGFKKGGAISKLRERSQTKKLSEGRQVVRRAEGGQLGNVSVPEEKPKPYEPSFNELFQTPDYVKLGLASALNEDKGTDKEFTEQDFAVETNRVVEHALELSKGNPNLLYEHYPNTAKGIPVRVFMGKELTTEEKKLRNEMYGGPDGYAKMLADIKMDPVLHAALTVGEAQKKTDGEYIIDERWNFNHLNNTSDNSYSLLRNIVGKSGLVAVGDESKGPRVRIKR